MKPTITLTRGLPASGKSTYAEKMMALSPGQVVRVERDMLRDQLFASRQYSAPKDAPEEEKQAFKKYLADRENTITTVQFAMAESAVKAGKSVIVSDTNLRAKFAREWVKFAAKLGADFQVVDFDVPVDECIRRDSLRAKPVGEKVIRDMSKFLVKGKIPALDTKIEAPLTIEPYDNPTDLPRAILVDIDGTLAKMKDRSPYDWHRVGEDSPVQAVIEAVKAAQAAGNKIIVMSGRDRSCEAITVEWLWKYVVEHFDALFMRTEGDTRKDNIVKYELFNQHVRAKYHVNYVLDDRNQVVEMWRQLGLACFQVAPGNF
jgi:predicted kinase